MKIFSKEEFYKKFGTRAADCEQDNEGQILLYTSIWRWSDGTLRDDPEPEPESD